MELKDLENYLATECERIIEWQLVCGTTMDEDNQTLLRKQLLGVFLLGIEYNLNKEKK